MNLVPSSRYFDLEKFILEVPVVQFLVGLNIADLYLRSTITDLLDLSNLKSLSHLTLIGSGSTLEELPVLPKIPTSFGLDGFPNLKSAAFMVNIDPTIRIRWWGPTKVGGVPTHLRSHEAFKDIELVD